jgi:DNA-binding MarR family transcriptional regulator
MVRSRTTVKPGLLLQPVVLSQLAGRLVEEVTAGSELVGVEFAVASWLGVRETATPTELSRELGMAPTTLSAVIDRLLRKGQVRKRPNPDDGRSYLLELTAKGRATNARNGARFNAVITRVRAELEAAEEDVLETMRVLEAALRRALEPQRLDPR